MDTNEFDRRSRCQPSEEELIGLATETIDNSGDSTVLFRALDDFLERHGVNVASLANGDSCA